MIQSPGFLLTILAFALVIGPLVFVHEMGHYWAARLLGVASETFSIGFGREVAGWTDRRGTRWKLGWLPLGGYVKFAGDMNAVSQPSADWLALPAAERARTFQAKPVWARAIIVAAGPVVNFVFAVLILAGFAVSVGDGRSIVGSILPGSAAQAAGLQRGDRIANIQNHPVTEFADLVRYVAPHPGQSVAITYERDGVRHLTQARISRTTIKDTDGNSHVVGQLGVGRAALPPLMAPVEGVRQTTQIVSMMATTIAEIVTGQRSAKELGGPVSIARLSGQQMEQGWDSLIFLIALVSINLGFINLLPVPMLDGGHLLFYAIEAVRRRPVGPDAQEWAFRGGLAAILALMLFVTFNDLGNLGVWKGLAGLIG